LTGARASGKAQLMQYTTVILGAGAAGMMCAAHAGGNVLVVDHAKAPGEKIRISGGGRCNFTNMHCTPEAFICGNPHFPKSALARYTQWDFIELVDAHGIAWHEKTLGQLFCDNSAKDIVAMLRGLMEDAGVELRLQSTLQDIARTPDSFEMTLVTPDGSHRVTARNLVVASGGKSIPKMGATGRAYDIAAQFGVPVTPTRAGLVPFTFTDARFAPISGTATPARVTAGAASFDEALLFTHRGLSGPAVLQASSYWQDGAPISLNLLPDHDLFGKLRAQRQASGRRSRHRLKGGRRPTVKRPKAVQTLILAAIARAMATGMRTAICWATGVAGATGRAASTIRVPAGKSRKPRPIWRQNISSAPAAGASPLPCARAGPSRLFWPR